MPSDLKIFLIIGAVVATLFFLAGGVNQINTFFDRHKEKPSPAETYQTMAACRVQHASVDDRFKKAECAVESIRHEFAAVAKDLNRDDEARSVALHNRINPLETQCASIAKEVNLATQRIAQFDAKLDRLLESSASSGKSKHS
jgi:septal ring factor EnvC (AmiA/AmiB activator)